MSTIKTTKKDIIWNYIAIFFNMGAGVLVLPMILHYLSADEIGLNYLMLTISSMVALIDFGFSPQIGRNVTYALSGAKKVEKEGLQYDANEEPNYRLLAVVIKAAKYIYQRLSLVALILLLTFGTWYIHHVTHGFADVKNIFWIWLLFCFSSFFNLYFIYYRSLLTGSGKIYESSVSVIISRLAYIVVCGVMVYMGGGLFSIVAANIAAPLVLFLYSHIKFYTPEMNACLPRDIADKETKEAISGMWYNAKRLGINSLGTFGILKANLFLTGLFLPLATVGSFGLLTQIVPTLSGISSALFNSFVPQISSLQVKHDNETITRKLSVMVIVYWAMMIVGGLAMIWLLPPILRLIGSNTEMPSMIVCVLYLIVMILEGNHTIFSTVITTSNKVPFMEAGLISGLLIMIFTFLSLRFTNLGLVGVVMSQGVVQLVYNNWKWPLWVLRDLEVTVSDFVTQGFTGISCIIKVNYNKLIIK